MDWARRGRARDVVAVESRAARVGAPGIADARDILQDRLSVERVTAHFHHDLIVPVLALPVSTVDAAGTVRPKRVKVLWLALGNRRDG